MSSDSEESDGSHFWSRPSSPHETFDNLEGADANGEWQSRHIGHQVDYRGEIMCLSYVRKSSPADLTYRHEVGAHERP